MRFDIITIFPSAFDSYLSESIIKRAREKKILDIRVHNLRDYTTDKHKTVDDRPYGGGPGMVMQIEPIAKAVRAILNPKSKILPRAQSRGQNPKQIPSSKNRKPCVVFLSARGKQFTAKMSADWAKKYSQIVLIAGHYEGVDERVKNILKAEEISIGPYVLTGGEVPAMVIVDAVSRHIPGVLGKHESLEEIRGSYPAYTRPEVFTWRGKRYRVPKVLLSGNHKKVEEWRRERAAKER